MSGPPRRASFAVACWPALLAFAVLFGDAASRRAMDPGGRAAAGAVAILLALAGTARTFVRYRERDRWLVLAVNLGSVLGVAAALVTVQVQR